jgi:hypothetical protein
MASTSVFIFQNKDGTATPNIGLEAWVSKLPNIERVEFFAAQKRQHSNRQKAIDSRHLVLNSDSYTWTDENTRTNNNHGADPVWYSYFYRWLEETGQEFIIKVKETN